MTLYDGVFKLDWTFSTTVSNRIRVSNMLLLPLVLLNSTLNLPHSVRFLESLEALESPDYVHVIKAGPCEEFVDLLKAFQKPKIITDSSPLTQQNGTLTRFNYLNLPRYKGITSVKYYFNRSFLIVILTNKLFTTPWTIVMRMLQFGHLSTIVFVSEDKEHSSMLNRLMRSSYEAGFKNVIHLSVANFEVTQQITTFENFPDYKLVMKKSYEKENGKNLRQREVSVAYLNIPPLVFISEQGLFGILVNFYENFVRFVNGTQTDILVPVAPSETEISFLEFSRKFEFLVGIPLIPLSVYKSTYPVSSEMLSNVLDYSDFIIIIPAAKPTEKKLYLVKIFSIEIWILTLIYVIYASGALAIYHLIIKKKPQFWRTFCQLLRCCLAQGFPYTDTFNYYTLIVYLIPLLFGYILTTWFNAILGSFVTTTLYDRQAYTLDDMRMQNIRIATTDVFTLDLFENMKEFNDILVQQRPEEVARYGLFPQNYALIVPSHLWFYHQLPLLEFYRYRNTFVQGDFLVEKSFLRVFYKEDAIYKEQMNRFIGLVKDTGLFKHWCDAVFLDVIKLRTVEYSFQTEKSSIEVLQLDFFTYPFYIWAAGLTLAFIRLLFEIGPLTIYYARQRYLTFIGRH